MDSLFFSPHNDDETLFGAFSLLRYKPHVIVCLKSRVQAERGGPTAEQREAETDAAMELLGCSWHQWPTWDTRPEVESMEIWMASWLDHPEHTIKRVFVPAVEEGGHAHHNLIGEMADRVFGETEVEVTHYSTYTTNGKSVGRNLVLFDPSWLAIKLRALTCYTSQIEHPSCAPHFWRDQREYYE